MKLLAMAILLLFLPGCMLHIVAGAITLHHLDLWLAGGLVIGTTIFTTLDLKDNPDTFDEGIKENPR